MSVLKFQFDGVILWSKECLPSPGCFDAGLPRHV